MSAPPSAGPIAVVSALAPAQVPIARPKDLARARNRMILSVEANFPRTFYALKNAAIKMMVR